MTSYVHINSQPVIVPPVICDFGWYYGITPTRLAEAKYQVGTATYPPGATVLSSDVTLSATTPFTIPVASTSSFEASGTLTLNSTIAHQSVIYTGKTSNTFTGCLGGTGSFATGVPVYDSRFYVDQMPLYQPITFDAVDSHGFGLPVTTAPASAPVASYRWTFGNGQIGYGPVATVQYNYSMPPPSIQATLTVTDVLGRRFSTAHKLNLQHLTSVYGVGFRIAQGTGRV